MTIASFVDSLNNSTSNFVATVNCNNTKVRFKLSEEEANSTNPSDSNNSTSTDSGAQGSAASASGGPGKMPGHQGGAFRQISTLSVSSSLVTESSSQSIRPTVEEMTLNPYRKYVEKYLKTKGLRKTMATLNRLIRGPLRRAKIALERPLSEEEQRSSHIVAGTVVNDAEHCVRTIRTAHCFVLVTFFFFLNSGFLLLSRPLTTIPTLRNATHHIRFPRRTRKS